MGRNLFHQLDIGLYSISSTQENCAVARRAEERGFRRVWLAEGWHSRGIFVQAAALGAVTKNLEIGFGIVSPFGRHPAVIAMEVASLVEHWGPRFTLGLGTARLALTAHGLRDIPWVAGLKEAGEICRRLLRGERVTQEGKVFRLPSPGVQLDFRLKGRGVPLYFGTLGPKSLRIAASMADGILFSVFCSPAFIQSAMEHVKAGAARAGRSVEEMDIASYIIFSVDRDGARARAAAKPLIGRYLMRALDPARISLAGLSMDRMAQIREGLEKAQRENRLEEAVASLPEDVVRALSVAGTPEECLEGLRAYGEAGVKTPVLYQVLGPDRLAAVDLVAEELRPQLVGG